MRPQSVLITGSSGFIGSFLVEEALQRGLKVFAGIRSSSNLQFLKDSRISIVNLNLSSMEELKESIQMVTKITGNIDIIIHNAGITKAALSETYSEVNYTYTKNMMAATLSSGISIHKFIYISSLSSYGPGDDKSFEPIKNNHVPKPLTHYGISKLKAEEEIKKNSTLPWVIVRPTVVYGPREKEIFALFKLINYNIQPWIRCKGQKLTFIYVKDLARTLLDIAESPYEHKSYFLSDGQEYASNLFGDYVKRYLNKKTLKIPISSVMLKIIASLLEKSGKTPGLNKDKAKEMTSLNWVCDINPIREDIGYVPAYTLDAGVKETIEWYKEQGWLN